MDEARPPDTSLHVVTGVADGHRFLTAARGELAGSLRWSARVDVPGMRDALVCLELPLAFDPESFFERWASEESEIFPVDLEDPPTKLFLVHYPACITREYCQGIARAVPSCVEVSTRYAGVIVLQANAPTVDLLRLKAIFAYLPAPVGPITVATRWQDVPVAHFANLPPDLDEPMFHEVFGAFLPPGAQVLPVAGSEDQARFHCCLRPGDDVWALVDRLAYGMVSDREIRVSHFCPHEDLEALQPLNLRVSGIHKTLTLAELTSIFSEYGRILSVYTKPEADSKVVVSLQYIDQQSYDRARRDIPTDYPLVRVLTPSETGFAVYNLKVKITEEEVRQLFPKVNDVRIERAKDPQQRPVVWVGYGSAEACEQAMAECEQLFSDNHRLYCVHKSIERTEAFKLVNTKIRDYQVENTVYFPSLPAGVGREEVIAACSSFGRLNSCVVILPQPPAKSLFGFAAFETSDAYQAALSAGTLTIRNRKVPIVKSKTNRVNGPVPSLKARSPPSRGFARRRPDA